MKISEFESLNSEELTQKLGQLKRELFDLRMQAANGKLDRPHRVKLLRRDAARILTLIAAQKGSANKALKQDLLQKG